MVPYEGCKVTGPYLQSDDYYNVRINWPGGKWKTVLYHRYLMEIHLGRILNPNEQIHHIDKNPSNNDLSNLIVVTSKEHGEFHRFEQGVKEFKCPFCSCDFELSGDQASQLRRNKRAGLSLNGPFCSRECATRYTNSNPPEVFTCPWCLCEHKLEGWRLSNHKSRKKLDPNKKDPYCSKRCSDFGRSR